MKNKINKPPVKKWRLSVIFTLRFIIDMTTAIVLTTTSYIGIFNKDIFFTGITVSIIVTYIIFIYKGFYSMRVEMKRKNITLISFPFARIPLPYKKIKSMEIIDRRWNDYLTGYGCKVVGENGDSNIYFRSRMSGDVVVIHTRGFRFKKIEVTLDSPEEFIREVEKKI